MTASKNPEARPTRASTRTVFNEKPSRASTVRAHFDLDRDLHHRLKIYAATHGETMKDIVERAVYREITPKR